MIRSLCALAVFVIASTHASAQCREWSREFAPPGVDAYTGVLAFATFDDGAGPALYVGGSFTAIAGASAARLAKWDGASWSQVGGGVDALVESLYVWDDGSGPALYVGGQFQSAGGVAASRIAKWNGSTFSALGFGVYGNPPTTVKTMVGFDDGSGEKLYVGGSFAGAGTVGSANISRWNGTSWETMPFLNGRANALIVFDDGGGPDLYVGGTFGQPVARFGRWNGFAWEAPPLPPYFIDHFVEFDFGSGPQLVACGNGGVARWNGPTWTAMPVAGCSSVVSIGVSNIGGKSNLYAGGVYSLTSSCNSERGLAAWNGAGWDFVGGQFRAGVHAMLDHDDGSGAGARLWLGGNFTVAGGYIARGIATFDGTTTAPIGLGAFESVRAMTSLHDASGTHLHAGVRAPYFASSSYERWVVERDEIGWKRVGGTFFNDEIRALATWNDAGTPKLVAGGSFLTVGGSTAQGVAQLISGEWDTFFPGPAQTGSVEALLGFEDGAGRTLFAGGSYLGHSYVENTQINHIAGWNGSGWTALDGGMNGNVRALCAFDDGSGPKVIAGGAFTLAGGVPVSNLASWDGSSWSDVGGGVQGEVFALTVFDDGGGPALFVGGGFVSAGSTPANRVARWNGASWSALGDGIGFDRVESFAVFDDGSGAALFVGGSFATAGGGPAANIARWDGATWSNVAGGASSTVLTLTVHDDGLGHGAELYVAGAFTAVDQANAGFISALRGCVDIGEPYCFGDGSGTACPCGNFGAPGNGCATSFAPSGAHLTAHGVPSVSSDTLVLDGTSTSSSVVTYFQGTTRQNGGLGSVFGDGLRCAGGSTLRLGSILAVGGASTYPSGGALPVSIRGAIPAAGGVRRTYQVWYRNAADFCTPSTFNLSNGLELVWTH